MDELAVVVDSVGFHYHQNQPVLSDLSMHIPKGQIYTLLGSNGCGKTTLLNILLGRLRSQKGNVHILGHDVKAAGSRLNHFIGYMPQEIALSPNLFIEDTFRYFAMVNHIKDKLFIQDQIHTYLEMLGLSDPKQRVGDLSGGQKRLLSLGVTLIYEPRILLLDEPTVGVDSLIRCKIWNHLRQICYLKQTTVLITTHYIDEAKQSNLVGFLKDGRMLAEESPQVLMRRLDCNTLEEVFYKLCLWKNHNVHTDIGRFRFRVVPALALNGQPIDANNNDFKHANQHTNGHHLQVLSKQNKSPSISSTTVTLNPTSKFKSAPEILYYKQMVCARSYINMDHITALFYREIVLSKRNMFIFLLVLLVPILTVLLFHSSYGRTPYNVPVAIFNGDTTNQQPRLSEMYLKALNTSYVKLEHFASESSAFDSVRAGRHVIALAFRQNFSQAFAQRYNYNLKSMSAYGMDEDEEEVKAMLQNSSIHTYYDVSRLLNVRFLNRSILYAFQDMIKEYGASKGVNPYIFSTPIEVKEVFYGSIDPNFQDLFLAGIIVITLFALNTAKAALELNLLRENGCLERDLNQGVRPFELLLVQTISSLGSLLIQVLLTLSFSFYILQVELLGSFWAAAVLVFITSCLGMIIGNTISILFRTQIAALIICFSVLVIIFFTSGTLWPVEGMPNLVRKIFVANPTVLAIRSLRSIMLRGWTWTRLQVLVGYLMPAAFCTVLFAIESVMFHFLNT